MKNFKTNLSGVNKVDVIPSSPKMIKQLVCTIFPAIVILICILLSCNRKVNLQQTKTIIDSTYKGKFDSTVEVIKTLSQAYESLLQSTSNSDVVFETTPCPDGKGDTVTRIINRVTIDSKGNKVYEGQIKSFRESASVMEKKYYSLTQSYDSLAAKKAEVEKNYSLLQVEKKKVVKSTFIPIWLWIVLAIVGLLWINERFSIFQIPFITRTTLFTKK
jgi:hypothetical protein